MFHSTPPYLLNINIKLLRTIQSQSSQPEPHFELLFGLFAPHGEELGLVGRTKLHNAPTAPTQPRIGWDQPRWYSPI